MDTLGQRIKIIRKNKKMTLVDVAGDQMTKGMLSLIENNKAQPSIENLHYLAKTLGVNIGELTDEVPAETLRQYLDDLRKIARPHETLTTEKALAIEELVAPIIDRLPDKYETSQILLRYLTIFSTLGRYEEGIEKCDEALTLCEKLSLYPQYVEVLLIKSGLQFLSVDYEAAYATTSKAYEMVNSTYYSIDVINKIHVLYQEATFLIAINPKGMSMQSIENLIAFCHEEKIFYFYAHIIRFVAYLATMHNDDEKVAYYRDLLERYSQLDTSEENLKYYHIFYMQYYANYDDQPQEVLKYCELFLKAPSDFSIFASVSAGKAYYKLGEYSKAQAAFKQLKLTQSFEGVHPLDSSGIHEGFAYKALTQVTFDEIEEAKETIQLAYDLSHSIPEFRERKFIDETYEMIMKL